MKMNKKGDRLVVLPVTNRKNSAFAGVDIISEVLHDLSVQFSDGYWEGRTVYNQDLFWKCFEFLNKDENVTIVIKHFSQHHKDYYELEDNPFLSEEYTDKTIIEFIRDCLLDAYEEYHPFRTHSQSYSEPDPDVELTLSTLDSVIENWDETSNLASDTCASMEYDFESMSDSCIDDTIKKLLEIRKQRKNNIKTELSDKLRNVFTECADKEIKITFQHNRVNDTSDKVDVVYKNGTIFVLY